MLGKKLVNLRKEMPVLARHEGAWKGEYVHVDPTGKIIDRHESFLTCRFPAKGEFPYYQINRYSWADGKSEELHFPGLYRDRRVWWDNDRIKGCVWEIDRRSLMLTWVRKDIPDSYLYEMIQISDDDSERVRTWHWFQKGHLVQRTLITERRTEDPDQT